VQMWRSRSLMNVATRPRRRNGGGADLHPAGESGHRAGGRDAHVPAGAGLDPQTVTKVVTVPATSRFNVTVGAGTLVPELTNESFAALISSTQPIAVERAVYMNANGVVWAAGTTATTTRLP
jgi:hypothetical protein